MSYQVLARKWRPQTFEDVVGQESVVKTLRTALETGRVHHAYLFTGSRGVGKTTLARLMAKEIATVPGPEGETARDEIARGASVDVVEIDGASNNSVDAIREIRENARFLPQSCRFKIFIIDEVHMLSVSAFNALLKILEEPPAHVKFIFATTEPHKLPVTILSRCQRYDFKRISTEHIISRLQFVLGEENVVIEEAGLLVIARAADGGMRDALSLADQVISFAASPDGTPISADQVTDALGLIDRRSMLTLTHAILDRDATGALGVIASAHSRGHDLRQLAEGVCQELRNLTIAKATGSAAGYADLSETDVADVDKKATAYDAKDLQRCFTSALEAIDAVAKSEMPRMAFELHVLALLHRPPVSDVLRVSEAITRLDLLARGRPVPPSSYGGGGGGGPAQTIVDDAIGPASSPAQSASSPAPSASSPAPSASSPAPSASSPAPSASSPAPSASSPAKAAPAPSASSPAPSASSPAKAAPAPAPAPAPSSSSAPAKAPPAAVAKPLPWEEDVSPSGQTIPPRSDPPVGALEANTGSNDDDDDSNNAYEAEADDNAAKARDAEAHDDAMAIMNAAPAPTSPPTSPPAAAADLEPESAFSSESRALDELARALPLIGIDPRWLEFVDALSKSSLPLAGHIEHGHVVSLDDGIIRVGFKNQTHEEEARRAHASIIERALAATAFTAFEIVPFSESASPSIAGARQRALDDAQVALEAHARAHPVVQKALALFGGEVRRVTRL